MKTERGSHLHLQKIQKMQTIDALKLQGKKVLIRVDFNVPLKESVVTDDSRIVAALPTINRVIEEGGIPVLMSHLGRPKGQKKPEFSLQPVADYLSKLTSRRVHFNGETIGKEAQKLVSEAAEGEMVLLENLRFYSQETEGEEITEVET